MPSSLNKQLRDQGLAPDELTLHLKYVEYETQFRCFYCAKGIFRQKGRILNVFMAGEPEESKIMTVPVSFQCPRCGCIYHISTINL